MLVVVFLGFFVALGILAFGQLFKQRLANWLFLLPTGFFIYFLTFLPGVLAGKDYFFKNKWVSSLGVHLDFKLDGLAMLFVLMITGIGALVYVYAARYLRKQAYIGRFYCYLTFFMASMLGLVLSDNLLSLFMFWELTSVSSFFLIGFQNENEDARKNSLLALAITMGGGFLLMAGFIVLGSFMNTYSIQEILQTPEFLKNSKVYPVILFLILAGAFTKSAQFPFHFWLPGAMKAPTPVSAYLHSATMVKAGIYLLARTLPMLGGTDLWTYTLMIVGGVTMVYAAIQSLFQTDLKGILAYSTIASLGVMVLLLGIGTHESLVAVFIFIIAHALYKATLFLVTGVIDFKTQSRDVTTLRGLHTIMPLVAIAGVLAAVSNAGIPLTVGFLGKEEIYGASTAIPAVLGWVVTIAFVISNVILFYAGFSTGVLPFIGKIPGKFANLKKPNKSLWIPPMVLGILGVLFGMFPSLLNPLLQRIVASTKVSGPVVKLALWHGFNMVLLLSVITLALGGLLSYFYRVNKKTEKYIKRFEGIAPKGIVFSFSEMVSKVALAYTRIMHNGYLRVYLMVIISFLVCIVGYKLWRDVPIQVNLKSLSGFRIYELTVIGIMIVAIILIVSTSSRLTAIVAMGVVGYCISLIFIFYGAPDLAMTQFTIDTLTVVLFMLVMFKLPNFAKYHTTNIVIRDAIISIAFGTLIAVITLQAMITPYEKKASQYYAENAYKLGKGKNVVNVILVDFRGFDTLIETIVLSIAAIGVYSMLKLKINHGVKEL